MDFQPTGSFHLLGVSRIAVVILDFAVFWLARSLRIADPAATVIFSVIFVGLYVSVTDLVALVRRASLISAVYLLVRLLYCKRDPLNAIGVTWIEPG
jgi:Competence protein